MIDTPTIARAKQAGDIARARRLAATWSPVVTLKQTTPTDARTVTAYVVTVDDYPAGVVSRVRIDSLSDLTRWQYRTADVTIGGYATRRDAVAGLVKRRQEAVALKMLRSVTQ